MSSKKRPVPVPLGGGNCDKCLFASYHDKKTWACRVGGFRDKGSGCNIMTGEILRVEKGGKPVMEAAFIDRTQLSKQHAKDILKLLEDSND